jgi:hypothetical protein
LLSYLPAVEEKEGSRLKGNKHYQNSISSQFPPNKIFKSNITQRNIKVLDDGVSLAQDSNELQPRERNLGLPQNKGSATNGFSRRVTRYWLMPDAEIYT